MNIEISKEKILFLLFFLVVFSCLAVGFYLDRRARGESEISFSDPIPEQVFADISGAVVSPGVYNLPPNSRVTDLIKACGGVLDNASVEWISKNLNLSDKLNDSQKLYIPFDWEVQDYLSFEIAPLKFPQILSKTGESVVSENTEGDSINVNNASQKELESLPGVGEVTAKKIIDNRPYQNLEELINKVSLSNSVVEKIQDLVVF